MINPHQLLTAFGGIDNIEDVDACTTRLRVEVKDKSLVDHSLLLELDALDVIDVDNNIQAIYGDQALALMKQLQQIIAGHMPDAIANKQRNVVKFGGEQVRLDELFVAPLTGQIADLSEVPDVMFAQRLAGEGFAIVPTAGIIVSPVHGVVKNVFPSKHAIGIKARGGLELLIHFGVNTVKLKGQGFRPLVAVGDEVAAGQTIMEVDIEQVQLHAKSLITPIVLTNLPDDICVTVMRTGHVQQGDAPIIHMQSKSI